jgi:hypothetical protein
MHQFFDEGLVTSDVLPHAMGDLEKSARRPTIAPARTSDPQAVRASHFELFASQRSHSATGNVQFAESAGPGRLRANSELQVEITKAAGEAVICKEVFLSNHLLSAFLKSRAKYALENSARSALR